jgi:hypothetical protein
MWWSLASAQVPADEVQERLKAAAGLPLTEALSLRAELDQRVRHGDDPAAVAAVDEANAAFVASLLDTGWPRSSVVGDPAAHQAWLLVQHQDARPDLQERALAELRRLVPLKEARPGDLAYLEDRVAAGRDQPQTYGTQGQCVGAGWAPFPIADAARVDQRRKALGLWPLAVYQGLFDCDGTRAPAEAALQAGDFGACADGYARWAEASGAAAGWWQAAVCSARSGRPDDALDQLGRAFHGGWHDVAGVENDPAFDVLRADPRFVALLDEARGPVRVVLDERIELLHWMAKTVHFDEFHQTQLPRSYAAAGEPRFGAVPEHPALDALVRLRRSDKVGYNAVSALGFLLDDATSPALRVPLEPFPEGPDPRLDTPRVGRFVDHLEDYARAVDFAGFRAETADRRRTVEQALQEKVIDEAPRVWFDAAFPAATPPRLTLVPDMLAGENNFAGVLGPERYIVLGSLDWTDDGVGDSPLPWPLFAHELAHTWVNPWVDEHWDALRPAAEVLYRRVKKVMGRQAYGDPKIVVYESLTRAVAHLYVQDRWPDLLEEDRAVNEQQSFGWIGPLAEVLLRHRSPDGALDLDGALPELAHVLESAQLPPPPLVPGALSRAYEGIVVPPHPELRTYVELVAAQVFVGVPFEDRPGRTVVAYGSPASVPLVAEALAARGITIAADHVVVAGGKRLDGERLVVITAAQLGDRAVTVYAAHTDDAVIGANAIFHGPFPTTVGRDGVVLYQGP